MRRDPSIGCLSVYLTRCINCGGLCIYLIILLRYLFWQIRMYLTESGCDLFLNQYSGINVQEMRKMIILSRVTQMGFEVGAPEYKLDTRYLTQ